MSVIRAEQVAREELAAVKPQYVFTMTDGGFAKRSRISDYRQQSRGGLGIKTMSLANEERGGLVGAFIVVEGDEILSITQGGQVVRSPINDDFRATGRSTMGVKFVTPKDGDAVAVVARSVESPDEVEEASSRSPRPGADAEVSAGHPPNRRMLSRMQQSRAGRRLPRCRRSPRTDLQTIQESEG